MTTKKIREIFDLTQNQLAFILDVSKRTIENWDFRDCADETYISMAYVILCQAEKDTSSKKERDYLAKYRIDHAREYLEKW